MPRTVNVHEAKTHLSRLLDEVAAGEEIVLAKAGKPFARLVPFVEREPRSLGQAARTWPSIADDVFFDPLPDDELDAWQQR